MINEIQSPPTEQASVNSATQDATKRTVLLIGGTGYVGDRMRFALRDAGYDVVLFIHNSASAAGHEADGFRTVEGDIINPTTLVASMQDVHPDAVINLVGIIIEKGDATFERMHYQGAVNVVDAMRSVGVRRLLQMSALGAGNLPDYPYHHHKWRAENYTEESGLDWTIFRPSIIFGPGDKPQFVSQMADLVRSAPITPVVGDGTSRFQPIHLDDVVGAYIAALADPSTIGHIYEIAGPEVVTYEEILDETARTLGKRRRKIHIPVGMMKPMAAVMEKVPVIKAPVTVEQLKMLSLDNTTDDNAAPQLLGRELRHFHGGINYIKTD